MQRGWRAFLAAMRIRLPSLLVVLCCVSVFAAEARTVRLLSIGNSFSRNATHYLADLAKAGGHELIHRPIVVGGASLELHVTKAQAHEADAADQAGLYADGSSLKQRLREQPWDFVTIQQVSIKSHNPVTYQPFGPWLADYVRAHAPAAKLMVHQTWAYRVDDPRFKVTKPEAGEPKTRAEMHAGLTAAYERFAAETGAGLLPVGDAFNLAETDPAWGFQPDTTFEPKKAGHPALPDQTHSLHVGWRWRKNDDGRYTLGMDGHHANLAGEYLGACVWYEVLFGGSCVDLAFVPKGLDKEYARFLRTTAHRAVSTRQKSAPQPATGQDSGKGTVTR